MASFRKIGKKWVAEVSRKGMRKSKRFPTKADAMRWALDFEHTVTGGRGHHSKKTLKEAFEKYKKEVSLTHKGARWEIIRLNKISRSELGDSPINLITQDDIKDWIKLNSKTLAPASVNRELGLLKAVFGVMQKEWKWIDVNPIKQVKSLPKTRPRDRRISDIEIETILKALGYNELMTRIPDRRQEIAIAFLLAIETAMRQGELWALDWGYVYLGQQYVTLVDTKNGDKRDVPLSKRAVALFKKLGEKDNGRVFGYPQASAGVIFRRALQLTGIKNLHFHDTRHEAISRLARKIDVLDLARMVGHRDPRSLMIYYNATASEIAGRLG